MEVVVVSVCCLVKFKPLFSIAFHPLINLPQTRIVTFTTGLQQHELIAGKADHRSTRVPQPPPDEDVPPILEKVHGSYLLLVNMLDSYGNVLAKRPISFVFAIVGIYIDYPYNTATKITFIRHGVSRIFPRNSSQCPVVIKLDRFISLLLIGRER